VAGSSRSGTRPAAVLRPSTRILSARRDPSSTIARRSRRSGPEIRDPCTEGSITRIECSAIGVSSRVIVGPSQRSAIPSDRRLDGSGPDVDSTRLLRRPGCFELQAGGGVVAAWSERDEVIGVTCFSLKKCTDTNNREEAILNAYRETVTSSRTGKRGRPKASYKSRRKVSPTPWWRRYARKGGW
jgi:hypothetical protein